MPTNRLRFRPDSPLWTTFHGFPGWDAEGVREIVPVYDLSESPYCCTESVASGTYEHFVLRGDPAERVYDYVGPCADVDGDHVHPGSWHGHQ